MGRVGAAGDNAAMENFFALLQKNVLNPRFWATREELRIAIVTWTERTYHRRRRQAALGRLTPIEFETIMTQPATQAARPHLSPVRAAVPPAAQRMSAASREERVTCLQDEIRTLRSDNRALRERLATVLSEDRANHTD
ncbi:hypothetical protein GCM10022199_07880 [Marihabitans asiaticum]|uniref:Integrase-like protein n=1 Tax=Marihabitans asiaticum TaxID=415218 RepID=A0A560WGK6_9MICO|nr:hypothetical protein FB557_0362 [Marihabitans asiaticum]